MTAADEVEFAGDVNGASDAEPLLDVQDLKKYFPVHGGILGRSVDQVRAVDRKRVVQGKRVDLG